MIWKHAWRELRNRRRFALLYILNLAIGLAGYLLVINTQTAVREFLDSDLRLILTGDAGLHARREITDEEKAAFAEAAAAAGEVIVGQSSRLSFFSMARGNDAARLVQIHAVDSQFPLYGELVLQDGGASAERIANELQDGKRAWLSESARHSLGLKPGDLLHLGRAQFVVGADIAEDPLRLAGAPVAPPVYISYGRAPDTGLVQLGSRVNYYHFYTLAGGGGDIAALAANAERALVDAGGEAHMHTYAGANEQASEAVGYAAGYLGLAAAAALLVAGVGISYQFRSYLNGRVREIAVLQSLGTERRRIYLMLAVQLSILGTAAAAVALAVAGGVLAAAVATLGDALPARLDLSLRPGAAAAAALLGIFSSLAFAIPALTALSRLRPALLFREAAMPGLPTVGGRAEWLARLPAFVFFYALTAWPAGLGLGALFVLVFAAAAAVLAAAGAGVLSLVRIVARAKTLPSGAKMMLRNLHRRRAASLLCFTCLAAAAMIFNLLPQLRGQLTSELTQPPGVTPPNLFVFDIQPEQLPELKTIAEARGVTLENISPMVRARLLEVNGKTAGFNDEDDGDSRRRGFNISSREKLGDAERIIAGPPLSGRYDAESDAPVEVSLERRFAQRQDLKVGDTMRFDVQGVEMDARVVNLRRVRWSSFQPNFFVLFQPGVLDDAPRTYVAGVSGVPPEERLGLQSEFVRAFPNLSVIDVGEVTRAILSLAQRITLGVGLLSSFSLLAVAALVFQVSRAEAAQRSWEMSLLKILGMRNRAVSRVALGELALLAALAAAVGVAASAAVFHALSTALFDSWGTFILSSAVGVFLLAVFAVAAVGFFALREIIRRRPLALLQDG